MSFEHLVLLVALIFFIVWIVIGISAVAAVFVLKNKLVKIRPAKSLMMFVPLLPILINTFFEFKSRNRR